MEQIEAIIPDELRAVLEGVVQTTMESVVLSPTNLFLGATLEAVCLPDDIVGQSAGKLRL